MFKRITNLWKKSEEPITFYKGTFSQKGKDKIYLSDLKDALDMVDKVEGDGKAEFLGEGTNEEFKAQEEADKGFEVKPFGL